MGQEEICSGDSSRARKVDLFGKYEVGKLLGCGSFAKVYHARNTSTGQSVAVKAVNKHKILKGGFTAQVKREVSAMRRLHHPNVVKLFEVLATKTKIYFVMEYVKGGELFTKLAKGRLTEDVARRYFQQLITAVGYSHARGVFHRDLKPENLLLDENLDLKVSDFGLSAVRDQIQSDGLLHTLCGTPAYVAPEILAKKGYDGAKVDIWSCGVILFVLAAGYLPFRDTNLMMLYRKIYRGEYRCPKWVSSDLRSLLSRLLDTNPETRIAVEGIMRDPWFRKDYKEVRCHAHGEDMDLKQAEGGGEDLMSLNAFDLISFSSGLDLSGLFRGRRHEVWRSGERFLSSEKPSGIIERVEEAAKAAEMEEVRRKKWGAEFEGQNGRFSMTVEIYRLTESLVVVEVKLIVNNNNYKNDDDEEEDEIWKDKLWPQLHGLIYYYDQQSSQQK